MHCFSVVIPNLNQSRFLADALESLKHQTARFQLALMDGGSKDGFESVAESYSDIISWMRVGPDQGQAAAIAEGFAALDGDIVCWLNADDYYFPGALDRVAAFFQAHPKVDVVYGDAVHVKPDGGFLSYFPAIEVFDAKKIFRSCFICQPACFVRRRAYEAAGGLNTALKYTMDWDLWCRLVKSNAQFQYMPALLAAVRCYPQTKTLSGDRRRYYEIWRIGKTYGNQCLPIQWAGFYLYDLNFKKNTASGIEKILRWGLQQLRRAKKRFAPGPQDLLYGFHRWEHRVEGRCVIEIPWYHKAHVEKIRIQAKADSDRFQVRINQGLPMEIYLKNGWLEVSVPQNMGDCCRMRMESMRGSWELNDFILVER